MKKIGILFVISLLAFAVASAQSAKDAYQVNYAAVVDETCGVGWSKIAGVEIHTSSQKDLVMGASLETTLYTATRVKSKGGTADKSEADAKLMVKVTVDGSDARPGEVTFDRRYQMLEAIFNGYCVDANADGIVQYTECDNFEELELILDTTAAHHFNFVLEDVGTGVHSVEMWGCVETSTTTQAGTATANAMAGKGSLVVEEVRLVKDQDVIY